MCKYKKMATFTEKWPRDTIKFSHKSTMNADWNLIKGKRGVESGGNVGRGPSNTSLQFAYISPLSLPQSCVCFPCFIFFPFLLLYYLSSPSTVAHASHSFSPSIAGLATSLTKLAVFPPCYPVSGFCLPFLSPAPAAARHYRHLLPAICGSRRRRLATGRFPSLVPACLNTWLRRWNLHPS